LVSVWSGGDCAWHSWIQTVMQAMKYLAGATALALALCCADAAKTLVLVDTLATRETHSLFLRQLTERGHEVTVKSADEPSLMLQRYGESLYDNLVLFCPAVEEFGGALSVEAIVHFIDAGGNVILAGAGEATDLVRELAAEAGVEVDEEGSAVVDHLHHDTVLDDGMHTTVAAPASGLLDAPLILGPRPSAPLLYRGAGLTTDPENPLLLPLLRAPPTAYSHNPSSPIVGYPHATGSGVILLAALQARNNARVLVSGSLDFFSDAFLTASVSTPQNAHYKVSGNAGVVAAATKWALKEAGVIRVTGVDHHRKGEPAGNPPAEYTIKESIEYHIAVEELVDGKWKPFQASDLQMEFVRIDPFVRATLKPSSAGKFSVGFVVPDVYGVFQFKVSYDRVGYTRLQHSTQVPVRPFLHTQYERFIQCAYPYYASAGSMMVGLFLFSLVYLHHKEPLQRVKTE